MPIPKEQRKLRARAAQKKCRAQQKARYEQLQRSVSKSTKAMEDAIEAYLELSGAVVIASETKDYVSLQRIVRSSTSRLMEVVISMHEEEDSRDSNDAASGIARDCFTTAEAPLLFSINSDPKEDNSAVREALAVSSELLVPKHRVPSYRRGMSTESAQSYGIRSISPRLTYGLWPNKWLYSSKPGEGLPPLDVVKYVQGDVISFSTALYWSTISLGAFILQQNSSRLVNELFYWVLPLNSPERVQYLLQRRLLYKPSAITPHFYLDDTQLEYSSLLTHELPPLDRLEIKDVYHEASELEKASDLVSQMMVAGQTTKDNYLDCAGVESRFLLLWGISTSSLPASEGLHEEDDEQCYTFPSRRNGGEQPSSEQRLVSPPLQSTGRKLFSSEWQIRLINRLTKHATCLGDAPYFPAKIVDDLALSFYDGAFNN
jgi:hypothetical protein